MTGIYEQRIKLFAEQEAFYERRAGKFPLYRFLVFLAGAVTFYFVFGVSIAMAVVVAIIFLFAFFLLQNWMPGTMPRKNISGY